MIIIIIIYIVRQSNIFKLSVFWTSLMFLKQWIVNGIINIAKWHLVCRELEQGEKSHFPSGTVQILAVNRHLLYMHLLLTNTDLGSQQFLC